MDKFLWSCAVTCGNEAATQSEILYMECVSGMSRVQTGSWRNLQEIYDEC